MITNLLCHVTNHQNRSAIDGTIGVLPKN